MINLTQSPKRSVPPEVPRLRQFILFDIPASAGASVSMLILWFIYDHPIFLIMALESGLNSFVLVWAWFHIVKDIDLTLTMIAAGLWMIAGTLAVLAPPAIPVTVLILVMTVMLALPYITRTTLIRLIIGSAIVSGIVGPFQVMDPLIALDSIPLWLMQVILAFWLPVMNILIFVLLWQYNNRLTGTISDLETANEALRESERQLEGRVERRTAELSIRNAELVESQRELALARDQALDATRAKSEFLAKMSHELRTPLNAIIGYSEMLQEEAEDLQQEEFVPDLDRINRAGRHLLDLINDVLDLSKIEAGRMDLFLEDFDAASLIDDVVSVIGPLATRNANTLEVSVSEDLGSIRADSTKIRQSLFNLLSNACKFTDHGTVSLTVTRRTVEEVNWIYFEVADTGIGMTDEQLGRMFQAFSQAEISTSQQFGGTGLGLVISQNFCRMMGGDIVVESEYGKGSTFTISLPTHVVAPEPTPEPVGVQPPRISPNGNNTALVIDDEPSARDIMKRYLTREGFNVESAASGEEGLKLARELRPSIITLDVLMPGMNGWAVLSAIKADPQLSDTPVIMLSVVDDMNMGYMLGATDYLTKPIDRERLASVVNKYRLNSELPFALVVDDDPDARKMLQRMLEREGWTVAQAANGLEAIEALIQSQPNVILLDLMMPEMDGFEFVQQIKQEDEWRSIPVVVITAKDLEPEEKLRLQGAVERIIQKGALTREALLREVRQLVSPSA